MCREPRAIFAPSCDSPALFPPRPHVEPKRDYDSGAVPDAQETHKARLSLALAVAGDPIARTRVGAEAAGPRATNRRAAGHRRHVATVPSVQSDPGHPGRRGRQGPLHDGERRDGHPNHPA